MRKAAFSGSLSELPNVNMDRGSAEDCTGGGYD
jgi:hypothetical protein